MENIKKQFDLFDFTNFCLDFFFRPAVELSQFFEHLKNKIFVFFDYSSPPGLCLNMLEYISLACFAEFWTIFEQFLMSSKASLGTGCCFLVWTLTSSSKVSLALWNFFKCLKVWPLRYKALSFSGSNSKTMSR